MTYEEAVHKWALKDYLVKRVIKNYQQHINGCKLKEIKAEFSSWEEGYCETCAYTASGVIFTVQCNCKKVYERIQSEQSKTIPELLREIMEP